MMLELESLATVGAFEATEDGGLIVGDQVALQIYHDNISSANDNISRTQNG